MITSLALLIEAVKAGLTGWQQIKVAIQGAKLIVKDDAGTPMALTELEPHIFAAEDARDAASAHAQDRITNRHKGDG